MSNDTIEDDLVKRLLVKTKPVPYAIWMAGVAVVTLPATLFAWAMHPAVSVKTIMIIQVYISCIGCLIGFFVVKRLKLPWFATFGEVLEAGRRPVPSTYKPDAKAGFASTAGFILALIALSVVANVILKSI